MVSCWTLGSGVVSCGRPDRLLLLFVLALCLSPSVIMVVSAACVQSSVQTFTLQPAYAPFTLNLATTVSDQDIILWHPQANRSITDITVEVQTLTENAGDLGSISVQPSVSATSYTITVSATHSPSSTSPSGNPSSGPSSTGPSSPSHTGASSSLKPSTLFALLVALCIASVALGDHSPRNRSSHLSLALWVFVVILGSNMVRAPCPPRVVVNVYVPWNVAMVCNYGVCYSNADIWKHGVNWHYYRTWPAAPMVAPTWGSVRTDVFWSAVEPSKSRYDFSRFDPLVNISLVEGLHNYWILCYGNTAWTAGAPPKNSSTIDAFVRFSSAMLSNFRTNNVYWEMWNEPDLAGFWGPVPSATEYNALASAVGQMIRAQYPEQVFVGPTMAHLWTQQYMRATLEGGMADYWDAFSIHPYRRANTPETLINDFSVMRQMIRPYLSRVGQILPLLPSEFGYSIQWTGITLEIQAQLLVRFRFMQLLLDTPESFWYDIVDDGTDPANQEHNFGAVFANYTGKPSYNAAQFQQQLLSQYTLSKRIAVSNSHWDFVLLFKPKASSSATPATNSIVFAYWTSHATNFSPSPVALQIPCGSTSGVPTATSYGQYGAVTGTVSCTSGYYSVSATPQVQYLVVDFSSLSASSQNDVFFLKTMAALPRFPLDLIPGSDFSGGLVNVVDASTTSLSVEYTPSTGLKAPGGGGVGRAPVVPAPPTSGPSWNVTFDSTSPSFALVRVQIPPIRMWIDQPLSSRNPMPGYSTFEVQVASTSAGGSPDSFVIPYTPHDVYLAPQPIDSTGQLRVDVQIPALPTAQSYTLQLDDVSGACCSGNLVSTVLAPAQSPVVSFYFQATNGASSAGATYNFSATFSGPANYPSSTAQTVMMTSAMANFLTPFQYNATSVSTGVTLTTAGTTSVHVLSYADPATLPLPVPISGAGVFQFTYNDPNKDSYFSVNLPSRPRIGNFLSLSMWIYGDASDSLLKVFVIDSNSQNFMIVGNPAYVGWTGWKLVTFDTAGISNFWNGPADGVPVGPFSLYGSFLFDHSASGINAPQNSTVWFTAPFVARQ